MSDTRTSKKLIQTEREILALAQTDRYEKVSLGGISLPKGLHDEAELSRPLPAAGLLNPILIFKNKSGRYEIIDGCKRFAAMKRKKTKECICGIVRSSNPKQPGLVRILLNRGRRLSLKEQFLFYSWLRTTAGIKKKNDIQRFLDIPWNQLDGLDALITSSKDVRSAVFENRLHAANAAEFGLLSEINRKKFLELFKGLGLSLQTEREFIQWMPEIIHSQNSGIKDFYGFTEIAAITKDSAINAPQKIQKINSSLRGLRFPRSENIRKNWETLAARVNPDASKVCFIPSQYFEKNRLEVRLVFSKTHEALDTLKKMSDIPETAWSRLINPYQS